MVVAGQNASKGRPRALEPGSDGLPEGPLLSARGRIRENDLTHRVSVGGDVFPRRIDLKSIYPLAADLRKNRIHQIDAANFGLMSRQMSDGRSVQGYRTA